MYVYPTGSCPLWIAFDSYANILSRSSVIFKNIPQKKNLLHQVMSKSNVYFIGDFTGETKEDVTL
jgi:hypothetical protein